MSNLKEWDKYFYDNCVSVSKGTKCLSRQIGTVLVKDNSIISTGYNGPPRGVPHCDVRHQYDNRLLAAYKKLDPYFNKNIKVTKCPRQILGFKSGEGLEWCVAGHAEENSILNAARYGIKTKGATLYMNCGIPCSKCLIKIINSGIVEIIVTKFQYYDISSEYLLRQSNLNVRLFSHLKGIESNERY